MTTLPAVSCVMSVGYGSRYAAVAIECFIKQDYAGYKELIILDNNCGTDTVDHLLPQVDVYYEQCEPMSVGALRNLGNSRANGDVLINWDEDDWSHPNRLTAQVERLQESGKAVTGWHNILFYDTSTDRCYKYFYARHPHPPYACGTSHAYLQSWWRKHPYPTTGIEDYAFQKVAADSQQLDSVDAEQLCVVRAHRDSKCPPVFGGRQFPLVERSTFPPEFFTSIQ